MFEEFLKMSLKELNPEIIPIENVDNARQIFEKYGDFIQRIIKFHVGNKPEADDLFQDLFLFLVLRPLPQDIRNIQSLLYRMITSRIIDGFRHEGRMKSLISRYAQGKEKPAEEFQENSLVEAESTEKMFDLIRKHLPQNEALVIMLRYKHGFDINETAKRMGVKPRSVSRYLSSAISKIRCIIKDKCEETL